MDKKDTRIYLRTSSDLVGRLKLASSITDLTTSQFVREAVNEKLFKLAKKYPQHKDDLAPAA
jgi:predicted DNA binding CopG/RHH family protein